MLAILAMLCGFTLCVLICIYLRVYRRDSQVSYLFKAALEFLAGTISFSSTSSREKNELQWMCTKADFLEGIDLKALANLVLLLSQALACAIHPLKSRLLSW